MLLTDGLLISTCWSLCDKIVIEWYGTKDHTTIYDVGYTMRQLDYLVLDTLIINNVMEINTITINITGASQEATELFAKEYNRDPEAQTIKERYESPDWWGRAFAEFIAQASMRKISRDAMDRISEISQIAEEEKQELLDLSKQLINIEIS